METLTEKDKAAKTATAIIMRRKVLKMDVISFGLALSSVEACEGATDAFHRQGPRLWGFWCSAMDERVKRGLPVPDIFKPK